jgi:hypothetical protein
VKGGGGKDGWMGFMDWKWSEELGKGKGKGEAYMKLNECHLFLRDRHPIPCHPIQIIYPTPKGGFSLFPPSWVIGSTAAALKIAKNVIESEKGEERRE